MHKWLLMALVVIVAIAAVGCKQSTQTSEHGAPTSPPVAEGQHGGGAASSAATGETVSVDVKFRLPEEEPRPQASATGLNSDRAGAPATHVARVLGVQIGGPGCTVAQVAKDSLAEKVGIKAGDVIAKCNGGEPTCAATLDAWLYCNKEPGLVEMTLTRGGGGEAQQTSGKGTK